MNKRVKQQQLQQPNRQAVEVKRDNEKAIMIKIGIYWTICQTSCGQPTNMSPISLPSAVVSYTYINTYLRRSLLKSFTNV